MDPCSREILQLCSSPTFHLIIVHICQVYAQLWQANTGARWRQPLVSNSWGVRWISYFAHIFWSSCIKDVFGGCAVAFLGGRRGALLCGHRRWSPCRRWASPPGGIKHITRETKTETCRVIVVLNAIKKTQTHAAFSISTRWYYTHYLLET